MIMPIVNDICPGLNGVHIIPLHQPNYLLIGLDLILPHDNAFRLIPVTCPIVPLALPDLVYFESCLWVHVQYVAQDLFGLCGQDLW